MPTEYVASPDPGARIKVIGAGGCGGNAINHMIEGIASRHITALAADTCHHRLAHVPAFAAYQLRISQR